MASSSSHSSSAAFSAEQLPGSPRQRAAKLDAIAKMAALASPPPPPPSPEVDRKRDGVASRDLESRMSVMENSMSRIASLLEGVVKRFPDSQRSEAAADLQSFQQQIAFLPATGSLFGNASSSVSMTYNSSSVGSTTSISSVSSASSGSPVELPSKSVSALDFLSSAVLAGSSVHPSSSSGTVQQQSPPLTLATVLHELRDKAREFGSLLAWVKSPDAVWRVPRNKHEVEALAETFDAEITNKPLKRSLAALRK